MDHAKDELIRLGLTAEKLLAYAEKAEDQAIFCRSLLRHAEDEAERRELLQLSQNFFEIREMYASRALTLHDRA